MPDWTDPLWLAEAHEWIHGHGDGLGAAVVGAIEQPHVRPWSTVMRVPTASGDLWFKANIGALAHEAAVVDILARLRPEAFPSSSRSIFETIQHDDFHDGQIFVRDGAYLFFDWGGACVSHPFFTMSVTLEGGIASGLDDVERSEDITPFRDAYLRPFRAYAERAELEAAHTIALPRLDLPSAERSQVRLGPRSPAS